MIEDVLHGLDINRHAIHLAASMLTLSAPKIDYNKMNLYNMRHGKGDDGQVHAGSLDLLINNAAYFSYKPVDMKQNRIRQKGFEKSSLDIDTECDLVIMNPPFTRNDIRNLSLPSTVRREVQSHEQEISKMTKDPVHSNAIDLTSVSTFFIPIADKLLNKTGSLAIVNPFTACTAASGKGVRKLLTDPERFHLELVVTSHDNRRISFSENTNIHECLIIARRPSGCSDDAKTAFVSLSENPTTVSEAYLLGNAIRKAMIGDYTYLSDFGSIDWRTTKSLHDKPWNAACFYDQTLASIYDSLSEQPFLHRIGEIASLRPNGRSIRAIFKRSSQRQNPDMRILWDHKARRQTTMLTSPDEFAVAKQGKLDSAYKLWEQRSNLLLANRMRLNLAKTPAVFSKEPIIGSAFIPVTPLHSEKLMMCKAWCAWFNSTLGVLSFLNIRQKNLTYPQFSMDGLRSLPVPIPSEDCNISILAKAWDEYNDKALKPLPEVDIDPVRIVLDNAVVSAMPRLGELDLESLRHSITLEPSVNNKKDPFRLDRA